MNVAVPQDTLELDGDEPRGYEDRSGSSGQPFYRQYCAKCGSHVYSHGAAYGALAFIKAGTLDDATWLTPTVHIWCAEKLPWVQIPEGATQVPRQSDLSSAAGKENRPAGRLEKWRPCWGQRWAAMYLNEPAKRRFRAPTKKDGACAVLGVRVSALAWRTPARDSPCAWAHYESPEVPRNAVTK